MLKKIIKFKFNTNNYEISLKNFKELKGLRKNEIGDLLRKFA